MKDKKQYIRWIAVFLWMGLIFFFSSQNGEESSQNNIFILQMLSAVGVHLQKWFPLLDVNFVIRKLAHMTEYFILAYLFTGAFDNGKRSLGKRLLLSGICSVLYASSDEFHQTMSPGRGPSIRDVMVDSVGVALALIWHGVVGRVKGMRYRV